MKLYEMDADRILAELEVRGEAYVEAKHKAAQLEAFYDRVKAAVYTALRKAGGGSIDDCKAATLESQQTLDAINEYLLAERDKDRAYLALERAREAVRLYQTVRSDMRRV